MLYDPPRHEPLCATPWSEPAAIRAIRSIAADARDRFDPQTLWPSHPRDIEDGEPSLPMASLYHGAAGVIWALRHLRRSGAVSLDIDFRACIASLVEHNRRFNLAAGIDAHSYLLGDAGVLLLAWQATRSPEVAGSLFDLVEANLLNPTCDFLWGSPGTMVAALHMWEATREAHWLALFRRAADLLHDQMHRAAGFDDTWIWTQALWGKHWLHLGAGHGLAGNMFPFVRGAEWLPPTLVAQMAARATQVFRVTARTEQGMTNWEPVFDPAAAGLPSKPLVQDCHGAPGIICRLAGFDSPELQALLRQGGELVWAAGPLNKGPGLCHGTAGNGHAFLKLHAMTGEAVWLERARAFAMHALLQSDREAAQHGQRRFSLWTGDLGVALYLWSCVTADAALPTLDYF